MRAAAALLGSLGALLGLGAPAAAATAGPAQLAGRWTFDEGRGTTVHDSVRDGQPLALRGGAGWGASLVDAHSLALDGHDQYAQSGRSVLDTAQSFTVSAWVDLSSTAGYQTFVSQDGAHLSGFFLQLRHDRFAFSVPTADSTKAPVTVAADAAIIPQPGEWYHLVGIDDVATHTLSLYVNGTLARTRPQAVGWPATGRLAVGRSRYGGVPADFVDGRIDDVRAYTGALAPTAAAALAGTGQLVVDARTPGPRTRPTQFGEFLEEISHAGDGGLYAELIRNRDLKLNARTPVGWLAVGRSDPAIALAHGDPVTRADPVSLKLSVPAHPSGGRVGVANAGWWGLPVMASTTYRVSLYARAAGAATHAPLAVDLQSDSGQVWASASVARPTTHWARYTATLTTPAGIPSSLENRFVISAPARSVAGGTDWFELVSVFPPTYDNASNGFRVGLMRRLSALRPGFLRIPGGNYLEGDTAGTRFDWEKTIGPVRDRPGHRDSAWGYWSQDGLGLLEYLELAQQLHARPILAVWAGFSLKGTVVARDELAPYVMQAIDEIQYAIGPTSSYWGHQRALDGHPAPFDVHMVEIGNEDFLDRSGSYGAYRYPMFYDAIHRAYPRLRMIATEGVKSRPVFAVDHHYYSDNPLSFAQDAHLFDSLNPRGAKVLVGEYGATSGSPTGTLADALGEAAFLTGTVRDSDVVIGASYAPLLVNVRAPNWPTSLIGFNALRSYGSPSYWVQKMMADNLGEQVIGTQVVAGTGTLFDVATESPGHTYLTVVNDGATAASTEVSLTGLGVGASGGTATVLSGPPDAQNSLLDPDAVVPRSTTLGALGAQFGYEFAPDSVTTLNLTTALSSG